MNVRNLLVASALATALLAATGCNDDRAADTADTAATADDALGADATDTGTDPMAPADAAGGPAETIALVMAVDEHEIAMAEQARGKGVEGDVLAYADTLHRDHSANLEADRRVAEAVGLSPAETEAVQAQKEKGHAVMERLAALDGEAYADAFVEAMIQGHTDALAMLDERIGTATDQEMQAHLTATRETIAGHLEMARALQDGDDGTAGDAADDGAGDDA